MCRQSAAFPKLYNYIWWNWFSQGVCYSSSGRNYMYAPCLCLSLSGLFICSGVNWSTAALSLWTSTYHFNCLSCCLCSLFCLLPYESQVSCLACLWLQWGPVGETRAYDTVLEVAMRMQQFQQRNLRLHGSWLWLLSEFSSCYGVSDAYTRLRFLCNSLPLLTLVHPCFPPNPNYIL